MQFADGLLSGPVMVAGATAAAVGALYGLYRLEDEDLARLPLVTAVCFVLALPQVPLDIAHVHLVLNGLAGLILGWAVFPALLAAQLLKLALFGTGNWLHVGLETTIMATPAVVCGFALRPWLRRLRHPGAAFAIGAVAGGAGSAGSVLLAAGALAAAHHAFQASLGRLLSAHLPLLFMEAVATAVATAFLLQVRPGMLGLGRGPATVEETA